MKRKAGRGSGIQLQTRTLIQTGRITVLRSPLSRKGVEGEAGMGGVAGAAMQLLWAEDFTLKAPLFKLVDVVEGWYVFSHCGDKTYRCYVV